MPPYHISSTSRALFRVFIAPNLPPSSTAPLRIQHTFLVPQFNNLLLAQAQARHKSFHKKQTQRHALSDHYTFDNAIQHPRINMIDDNNQFHTNVSIDDALRSYNRVLFHLLQISEGKVDEFGNQDPKHLPTCKIISKMELRMQHERKLDIERRRAKGLGTGPPPKNLELNWAIAGGDIKHRLEKLKGFLQEGRKVEVLLGPKRKGRKATAEEAQNVLTAVRKAASECKGSREAQAEGSVGGVMTLVFEGRRLDADKNPEE